MWALTNVRVLDGRGGFYEGAGVLVDDFGRIAAVATNLAPPVGIPVTDGHNLWLLPGMVDAHTHLGLSTSGEPETYEDVNESTEPVTADVRALDGINPEDPAIAEALAAGVTAAFVTMGSANVLGGIGATIHLAGRTVEEMVMVPAAGMKAALGENPKRWHGERHGRRPRTRPGTAAVLREWLERARRYVANPPVTAKDWDPKLEALAMVVRGDVPLRIHCHRADDILTAHRVAAEFGLRWVIDHGTEADRVVEHVVRWGVPAVIGPSFATRVKLELKHMHFRTPGILARAGVLTAIASDHPVVPSEYLAVYAGLAVREGMDPAHALAAVTSVPAAICGIGDRVGTIEAGKEADFVLWEANPLESLQARPRAVYIGGEIVFQR
jgi:imidazolonepropionase-like amidohydrolase